MSSVRPSNSGYGPFLKYARAKRAISSAICWLFPFPTPGWRDKILVECYFLKGFPLVLAVHSSLSPLLVEIIALHESITID